MKIILTPKITFQILLEIQVSIASYLLHSDTLSAPRTQHAERAVCYSHQSLQDWFIFIPSNTYPWDRVYFRNLVLIFEFPFAEIVEHLNIICLKFSHCFRASPQGSLISQVNTSVTNLLTTATAIPLKFQFLCLSHGSLL